MDLGAILLIFALIILVGIFISRPLVEKREMAFDLTQTPSDHERSSLMAERDQVLSAIQELDFDFTLGKIPESEYPVQRATMMAHGAEVLRRLDELQSGSVNDDIDQRLEAAIAARRADMKVAKGESNGRKSSVVSASVATPDDDIEVMLANRRRVRLEKAAGFCHKCGAPIQKSDKFCPRCGVRTV